MNSQKNDSVIKIRNLMVRDKDKIILDDISADIKKGKVTAIIGASGCGKSTLLRAINKLLAENLEVEGRIYFKNNDIEDLNLECLRRSIGMVFQKPIPLPFSIEKNLTYAIDYHESDLKTTKRKDIIEILKKINLYEEINRDLKMKATKLSGGQQQRLCIARTLMINPQVILLDEPCSSLDIKNNMIIEEIIKKFRGDYTIIIVTHNLSQAKRLADNVIYMENGKIVETGDNKDIFFCAKHEKTKKYLSFEKL